MKKQNPSDTTKKKPTAVLVLGALSIAVLAGTLFLLKEPQNSFSPASTETASATNTWKETAPVIPDEPPVTADTETSQTPGTPEDLIQEIVSEDDGGITVSLSKPKEEPKPDKKPPAPPVTKDDTTNPEKKPEYDDSVPQDTGSSQDDSAAPEKHPGQVYDPVFGWIDAGPTYQDTIDSDGDIGKQIGTM